MVDFLNDNQAIRFGGLLVFFVSSPGSSFSGWSNIFTLYFLKKIRQFGFLVKFRLKLRVLYLYFLTVTETETEVPNKTESEVPRAIFREVS